MNRDRNSDVFTLSYEDEVNIHWENYHNPLFDVYNENQVQALLDLPLQIGEQPFRMLYLSRFADLEERILQQIDHIQVTNHQVMLCNEVFYTTKIEGANTTKLRTSAIHQGAIPMDYSEQMVYNSFQATKYMNLKQHHLDHTTLRTAWELLTKDVLDNADIQGTLYRDGYVRVGIHEGVSADQLYDAMSKWLDFYHSEHLEDHPLLKSIILHYTFAYIHPFCDGNGRMARLLMNHYLIVLFLADAPQEEWICVF